MARRVPYTCNTISHIACFEQGAPSKQALYSKLRSDEGSKSARASSVVSVAVMVDEQAHAAATRFTYMFTLRITRARQERDPI